MSPARSALQTVRNPVLALPAARAILEMHPDSREYIARLLMDIARDARARAQHSWKRHKAPMALYWKCVSVYAGHIARALRGRLPIPDLEHPTGAAGQEPPPC